MTLQTDIEPGVPDNRQIRRENDLQVAERLSYLLVEGGLPKDANNLISLALDAVAKRIWERESEQG